MNEVGAVVSHWRKASSPRETNLAIRLVLGSGFAGLRDGSLLVSFPPHPLALRLDAAAQK